MTELGPAEAPPTAEQLLAALQNPVKTVIEQNVSDDTDSQRVYQYSNARRNYLMYRGFQWLARGWNGQVADWAPVGGAVGGGGLAGGAGLGDQNCYSYHNNIFRGNGRKFIAVIGQRAPNTTAIADDPDSDRGEKAAREADKLNVILDSWWNIDERNMEVAEIVWTMGPAFLYTPWNADGELYGYREEPKYETEQVPAGEPTWQCIQCGANQPPDANGNCPSCGTPMGPESQQQPEMMEVPKVTGTQKYPNGRVECHVESILYVTTPYYTRDLLRCPWLDYQKEEPKAVLLSAYPELRNESGDDGSSDTGTSAVGRQARDSVLSPTGTSPNNNDNRWLHRRIWLRTWMYELIDSKPTREMLAQNFPDGLKVTMVRGKVVRLENERLDHVWSVIKPEAGEGINLDPVGQDLVSPQLAENQFINIAMETFERGIPVTLADPRVWNFQQMRKKQSLPAEFIPALPAVGDSLANSFFQTQPARFSEQQEPFRASYMQSATQNVGIVPQIFGGGNASTAREAEIQKNAAMMQLGITWTYFRKGWEAAKANGVRQLAKYGPAIVQDGQNVVEMSQVLEGNWHFEADEAIPSTWGQQRDLLLFMMDKPPQVLEAWGYNHPYNIANGKKLLGMNGWYTPNLDDIDKFKDTVAELLKSGPIQQPQPDGSMQTLPSIPVDQFEDNHALAVQFVQAWAQSEAGRTARRSSPEGYANVIAWGLGHQQAANPPAPPPPPPQPKLSLSASLDKMAPDTATAILGDFNVQVPPPAQPPGAPNPVAAAPPPPGAAPPAGATVQ